MSWCDSLASTPAIGIKSDPIFRPAEEILSIVSPILGRESEDRKPAFHIETLDPFSLVFNTESGFRYTFDHSSVSVAFNHRVRAKASSAGPPTMELISRAAPYTALLDQVSDRLEEALALLGKIQNRMIYRIGVVSTTQVTLDDAPPGIVGLFEKIGLPLGGTVEHFTATIATRIRRDTKAADRCAHTLTLPEPPETLSTVQLDWQRTLAEASPYSQSLLSSWLKAAEADALSYFERFAEGGLDDVASDS